MELEERKSLQNSSNPNSEEEESDEDYFEVESIEDMKIVNGEQYFYVKW